MNNRDVATLFAEIADLLEFQNANPFRVRAYRNAARRITDLPEPLEKVAADPDRQLTDIDGVGKDLAQEVRGRLGRCSFRAGGRLAGETPGGGHAIAPRPGLGQKKARALQKDRGTPLLAGAPAAGKANQVQTERANV